MKKLFILSIAITASLLFVQCKKTEIISEEFSTVEKYTGNILSGTSWEVLSVVSAPENINLTWSIKKPKINFFAEFIELKLGRDLCVKNYELVNDVINIDAANCNISNQNHDILYNLLEEKFTFNISDDGQEMILKNIIGTEVTLRRVIQLGTSNLSVNLPNHISL